MDDDIFILIFWGVIIALFIIANIIDPIKNFIKKLTEDKNYKKLKDYINQGFNVFITGSAGTGKSFVLNKVRKDYPYIHITSTTGISAINVNGQTLHSWAGVGICNQPINIVVNKINKNAPLFKQISRCKILAIDEISMLNSATLDYVNEVLKQVRKDKRAFGGIQVLIFGDFLQLPPVQGEFCFESKTWEELELKTILLTEVKRQTEKDFIHSLNRVRDNSLTNDDITMFYDLEVKPNSNYDTAVQIFGRNDDADTYNKLMIEKLETIHKNYVSEEFIYNHNSYDVEEFDATGIDRNKLKPFDKKCLENLDKNCKAPQILTLKVGCRVMLLRNLNVKGGLANGSCGTVKGLFEDNIFVKFDNGTETFIKKEDFDYIYQGLLKAKRKQYPLRLAYGLTIHKAQGMTFDKLMVNFGNIFADGQGYVALSRTRSKEGLMLKSFNPNLITVNEKVVDFYKKIRQSLL